MNINPKDIEVRSMVIVYLNIAIIHGFYDEDCAGSTDEGYLYLHTEGKTVKIRFDAIQAIEYDG